MTREIKRPDVALRNRLLKTRSFPSKSCLFCGGEMPIRVVKTKRYQNGIYCNRQCYGASRVGKTGSLSPNWQGGKCSEAEIIRSSREYAEWRKAVFERDQYKCVECGDDSGGNLHADHIKQFAYYPELRLDVSNGRTLCEPCHRKTDTWANNKHEYAAA